MVWKKYTGRYRDDLYKLLSEKEHEALSFSSRFIRKPLFPLSESKELIYICTDKKDKIEAALMLTKNGQLLPVLKRGAVLPSENSFQDIIRLLGSRIYYVNSMMGEENLINSLYRTIRDTIKPERTTEYFYHIMIIRNRNEFIPPDPEKLNLEYSLRKPVNSDIPRLLPLQELYEKEEVLPDSALYDPDAAKRYLVNSVKNQISVICEKSGTIVSKANTNGFGIKCCQIGGVFTLPELRNRGIGKYVTGKLVEYIFETGKSPSLFVKKKNIPAVSVYKKLGFTITSSFKIIYFF